MPDKIEVGCRVIFTDTSRPEVIALGGPDVPVKVIRAAQDEDMLGWWLLQAADGWSIWVPGAVLARVDVFDDSDNVMLLPDGGPEV